MLSDRVLLFNVGSSSGCFLERRESIPGGSATAFLAVMLQETTTEAPIKSNEFAVSLDIAEVGLPERRLRLFILWRTVNRAYLGIILAGR